MPYEKYRFSIIITGFTRSGKTTGAKRLASYIMGYYYSKNPRPIIILDSTSTDWALITEPNIKHKTILRGEEPFGIDNIKIFAPTFSKMLREYDDKIFGFYVNEFEHDDFVNLGFSDYHAMLLTRLSRQPRKNLTLISLIKILEKNKDLDPKTRRSLVGKLSLYLKDNFFLTGHRYCHNIEKELMGNAKLLYNFYQHDEIYYTTYGGKILRDLYRLRRIKKIGPPAIFVEEADLFFEESSSVSSRWLLQIAKRGGKEGFGTMLITQLVKNLGAKVRDNIKTWIIGNINPRDRDFFKENFRDIYHIIINLRPREFVIVNYDNQKEFNTFFFCDSLVETHKEEEM